MENYQYAHQLLELYGYLQNGTNVKEISDAILEIYSNPLSIFDILNIITNGNVFQRLQASIGLQKILAAHWRTLKNLEQAESIKANILQVLKKEDNQSIQATIVYAMEEILHVNSDNISYDEPWEELFPFLEQLFQSNDNNQYKIALKILFIMVPSSTIFPDERLKMIMDLILEHIVLAMNNVKVDMEYFLAGAELFMQLLARAGPIIGVPAPQPVPNILQHILTTFHQLLIQGYDYSYKVSEIISGIIRGNFNNYIPNEDIYNYLCQMLMDERISPNYHYLIFAPIEVYFDKTMKYLIKPNLESLLNIIFRSIALNFCDECYQPSSTAGVICGLIDSLCNIFNGDKLYGLISGYFSKENQNVLFASVMLIYYLIENSQDSIIRSSSEITKFLLEATSASHHHSIREVAMIALGQVILVVNCGLNYFFQDIINTCFSAVGSNDDELMFHGVETLTIAISSIEYDTELTKLLFEKLIEYLQQTNKQEMLEQILSAISSLLDANGENLIQYIPKYISFFVNIARADSMFKGRALEALAKMISYAPNNLSMDVINVSLQMLISAIDLNDSSIFSDLLNGFSSLVNRKNQLLQSSLPKLIDFATGIIFNNQFGVCISYGEEEDDELIFEKQADCLINAISLLDEILLENPKILEPKFASNLFDSLSSFLENMTSSLGIQKIVSILTTIVQVYELDPNDFLEKISFLFEECEFSYVQAIFECITNLIKKDANLNTYTYKNICKVCCNALNRKLPCFECNDEVEEEETDDNLNYQTQFMNSVFDCLSIVAKKHPEYLIEKSILSIFNKTFELSIKNKRITEILSLTEVIGNLFESLQTFGLQIEGLSLKFLLKNVLNSIQFCDGTNKPSPLVALRIIIDKSEILSSRINDILNTVNGIFSIENEGQPYYEQTFSSASSLMLSLFKIFTSKNEQFDYTKYINKILSVLPTKYESMNIYSSILMLYNQYPELFSESIVYLIIGISKTLALSEDKLNSFGLTDDVYIGIIKLLSSFLKNVSNCMEIIHQEIKDDDEIVRIVTRLQSC